MYLAIPLAVIVSLALLYLGQLYFRQNAFVFRPGKMRPGDPAQDAIPFEDVQLPLTATSHVRAWWVPASHSDQAVIFFHGTDGNITYELGTVRFLHSLSINALLVEYPGYEGNGVRPSERGCYQAAEAAWRFVVHEKSCPPEQVVLYGHSLGGAVATYLASGRNCGGLVIHSGFTSVPDMAARAYPYLPVRPFCRTRMDSLQRIAGCACPLLVLHSEEDEYIPIEHGRRLFARAPGPKNFIALRGSHFNTRWQGLEVVRTAWLQLITGQLQAWE